MTLREWTVVGLWPPIIITAVPIAWLVWQTAIAIVARTFHSPFLWWSCCGKFESNRDREQRIPATILIPAHNEADVIEEALRSTTRQLTPADQVVVIADNCHDKTAALAGRFADVRVLERFNDSDRGKGFALQFALEQLREEGSLREIVVMIDADCRLGADALERLIRTCQTTGRPTQSLYRIGRGEPKSASQMLSYLALTIKNQVRPLALAKLRLGNLLTGSGMAFPADCLAAVSLASDNTADDMELSCELALSGVFPTFCAAAEVDSAFPNEEDDRGVQRKRWIHGHVRTMLRYAPRLLASAAYNFAPRRAIYALELCVPPLSMLVAVTVLLWGASCWVGWWTQTWTQVIGTSTMLLLLVTAIAVNWFAFARREVPWTALVRVPLHLLSGLAAIAQGLVRRQGWTDTSRRKTEATP